ncbi:histidine phosphatase family protein [Niallia circulans]|uniref:histidine phosphatase family protein n=1 Tax=Niallia circulans TaxID=1397 RepID=UPI00203B29D8|nr:histidine phosphatase family protein [Niallia circulans]MCM2982962.1 histidine phosphatase family protein [Niallia circulans]
MITYIYMVRHGESSKAQGTERTRGLTEKGKEDSERISKMLQKEEIDLFVSSPYQRAILTINDLAAALGKEVFIMEDLKEKVFSLDAIPLTNNELYPYLSKSFSNPDHALAGAESNRVCQKRAIKVLKQLLTTYVGKKIVIGTHGGVMTLMMSYYDRRFDLDFLLHTTKPDIYRMKFMKNELVEVERLWE